MYGELTAVASGRLACCTADDELTVADLTGLDIQDAAVAALAARLAGEHGRCWGCAAGRPVTVANPITGLGASIQRRSTTEQAAEAVRQAILSGLLLPGMPLREAAVAAELGVSRIASARPRGPSPARASAQVTTHGGSPVVADITGPDAASIRQAARAPVEVGLQREQGLDRAPGPGGLREPGRPG